MTAYDDGRVSVHLGDCLDVLRTLPDASVDAVVTDPPYGLEFMGKSWDSPWKSAAGSWADRDATDHAQPENRGQTSSPFLAAKVNKFAAGLPFQQWCELWTAECLRVLKPGGHLLAFGGTRTWHRLACAVEDAGFEVRDSIAWLYGSGFPKSLDVSKAIDKRPGVRHQKAFAADLRAARERAGMTTMEVSEAVMETSSGACWNWENHQFPSFKVWPRLRDLLNMDAEKWDPVFAEAEREVTGQRSTGIGTGKGSVAIMGDGHRDITAPATPDAARWQGWGTALKPAFEPVVVARKPLQGTVAASVLAHGTGALNIDGCRVGDGGQLNWSAPRGAGQWEGGTFGDAGNADKIPSTSGRWPANVVLDESQAQALDEQSGERAAGNHPANRGGDRGESVYALGHKGTNGERKATEPGGASRFFYVAKAPATERPRVDGTAHPTVKPLDLMRWLVRLVTPPGGTVLEPFAGSGTTVEACIVEGFRCIAIEREPDYLPLILQRIHRRRDPVAAIRQTGDDLGLFELDGEPA